MLSGAICSAFRPRREFLFFSPIKSYSSFSQFFKTNCMHSFNIQDHRSTRFPCTINYIIEQIIKTFHEENSTMLGLFSGINLLLCSMQGIRNNELLERTFETFSKSPIRPAVLKLRKKILINNQDKKNNSVKRL